MSNNHRTIKNVTQGVLNMLFAIFNCENLQKLWLYSLKFVGSEISRKPICVIATHSKTLKRQN